MTKKVQITIVAFMLMAAMSLTSASPCQAATIYVDSSATGANDGSSWLDAYSNLQDAMYPATTGDEIWVAAGTYKPTFDYGARLGDRGKHFRMENGVAIYGGFAKGGDTFANRNPKQYETILSGDLLGNDNPATPVEDLHNDPNRTDNCYHVFYHRIGTNLDATAILDGFTITAGNANGIQWPHSSSGGGMYNYYNSPTLIGCTFTGNIADNDGSGLYNFYSSPTLIGCIFTSNSTGDTGGGMFNAINSSPTVISCIFSGNSAPVGGGMYNLDSSSPTVISCSFSGNSADVFAGGMYNRLCSPIVIGCTFTGNSAGDDGGGMFNSRSDTRVLGCSFTGNSADDGGGGGMYNGFCSPIVIGCTFSGNSAGDDGGGIWNNGSNPILSNCILWNNKAYSTRKEIYNYASFKYPSTPLISYCDITGCLLGGAWDSYMGINEGGNIDADPLFFDADGPDDMPGTEDDNLRLSVNSPCIDRGDPDYVAEPDETDLDGNPRVLNGRIDIGAYEYSNGPPTADAGEDIVGYAWFDGFGVVEPNGFGSFDPDGDELGYRWSWEIGGEVFEANGVMPLVSLPVGEHIIELVVFDGSLYSEPNSMIVTVIEPVAARGFVVPRVLSLSSRSQFVMGVLYLPDGVQAGDIVGGSFGLYVDGGGDGIPAEREMVIGSGDGGRVIVVFDRAAAIEAVGGQSSATVYVAGELESGECIYGSDTIRVVRGQRRVPRRPSSGRVRGR